jgi:hypothetical protein
MGSRIVKQPNGKLARFSEIVDNFTHINMDVVEATRVCMKEGMGADQAYAKVERGMYDISPNDHKSVGDGTERWNDALSIIKSMHGQKEINLLLAEIKGPRKAP